jgi:Thiamine pyrophosphate enzyme, C-terminal TPP binding domain
MRLWLGRPMRRNECLVDGDDRKRLDELSDRSSTARSGRFPMEKHGGRDQILKEIGSLCEIKILTVRVAVIGQPLWAAVGYSLPALLGTLLAAPRRRQLLFIEDGAFQMTAQELSTILRRGLKAIIFLINNKGYTIERLILGSGSSYNDINQWRYADAVSFFDTQSQAIAYRVRTEDELEDTLAAVRDREALVLIELVMSRFDAPRPLVNFAQRCAEFNFPHLAASPVSLLRTRPNT